MLSIVIDVRVKCSGMDTVSQVALFCLTLTFLIAYSVLPCHLCTAFIRLEL